MAKEQQHPQRPPSRETAGEQPAPAQRRSDVRTLAAASPFTLMRRFIEDIDRLFEGFGSGGLMPRIELGAAGREGGEATWVPAL
jgi:hypothetical protein